MAKTTPRSKRTLTYRNLDYLKPRKFKNYLTLTELSRLVSKDATWIKKLESEGRIPKASRVKMGKLEIRLWSPEQVEEIQFILSQLKPGRPSGS